MREQTRRALENIAAVLDAADRSLDDVVKTTVFVTDIADYRGVNEVFAEYMGIVVAGILK